MLYRRKNIHYVRDMFFCVNICAVIRQGCENSQQNKKAGGQNVYREILKICSFAFFENLYLELN